MADAGDDVNHVVILPIAEPDVLVEPLSTDPQLRRLQKRQRAIEVRMFVCN